MAKTNVAERFLTAPLLSDVEPELRRAVLNVLVEGRATAGSVLLHQGQPNDRLSFLIEGTTTVERTTPDGHKEIMANLTAPAVFGTTSFFRPNPPSVTVRATSDVCLLTLDHPRHERLRRDNPRASEALAVAIVRILAERFDLLSQRVADLMGQHDGDPPKATEWSGFRARLFEESNI